MGRHSGVSKGPYTTQTPRDEDQSSSKEPGTTLSRAPTGSKRIALNVKRSVYVRIRCAPPRTENKSPSLQNRSTHAIIKFDGTAPPVTIADTIRNNFDSVNIVSNSCEQPYGSNDSVGGSAGGVQQDSSNPLSTTAPVLSNEKELGCGSLAIPSCMNIPPDTTLHNAPTPNVVAMKETDYKTRPSYRPLKSLRQHPPMLQCDPTPPTDTNSTPYSVRTPILRQEMISYSSHGGNSDSLLGDYSPDETRRHSPPYNTPKCTPNLPINPNSRVPSPINARFARQPEADRAPDTRTVTPSPENNPLSATPRTISLLNPPVRRRLVDTFASPFHLFSQDTRESDDPNFSPNRMNLNAGPSDETLSNAGSESSEDDMISDEDDLEVLAEARILHREFANSAIQNAIEDVQSGLFDVGDVEEEVPGAGDEHDKEFEGDPEGDTGSTSTNGFSRRGQREGLDGWQYAPALKEVSISVNDVDVELEQRFLTEANRVIDNVFSEVEGIKKVSISSQHSPESRSQCSHSMTRLEILKAFLPQSLLQKVAEAANRGLVAKGKKLTDSDELLGMIILHVLCASYGESPSTVCAPEESECFLQLGIKAERYREVRSALSGTRKPRGRVRHHGNEWVVRPTEANNLVLDMEQELAAINRRLVYVPCATIFSLDDDHLRLSSRSVTQLTSLKKQNNPAKALGPVNNAVCSALTSAFICVPTKGALLPMPDAIFASDRGYNCQESKALLNQTLGATALGTCKRSLDYPFIFGDTTLKQKYKGVFLPERGCRAVYSAKQKSNAGFGRVVEAAVYRESFSGRHAAVYHNNERLFSAEKFTLVPKDQFRGYVNVDEIQKLQTIDDIDEGSEDDANNLRLPRGVGIPHRTEARACIESVYNGVSHLTYYQSEDPGWFLLRAFSFTSRTSHSFTLAVAKDCSNHLHGLASTLKGRKLQGDTHTLPVVHGDVLATLEVKWNRLFHILGVKPGRQEEESDGLDVANLLRHLTDSTASAMKVEEMKGILRRAKRRVTSLMRKAEVVEKLLELSKEVIEGTFVFDEDEASESEADFEKRCLNSALRELRIASLNARVMKPLVSTAGMREGLNEESVLQALPHFLKLHPSPKRVPQMSRFQAQADMIGPNGGGCMRVEYVRTVGLVCRMDNPMIADSSDGICALVDENERMGCAIEVKTMTSPRTIEKAKNVWEKYGYLTNIDSIGVLDERGEGCLYL